MACCAALAFALAFVRTAWGRLLGRAPAEDVFPPAATWRSGAEVRRSPRVIPAVDAGTAIGRPLAATVFAYAVLAHLLVAAGLTRVEPSGVAGWAMRDSVLAAAAIGLLLLGRRRTATAPALPSVRVTVRSATPVPSGAANVAALNWKMPGGRTSLSWMVAVAVAGEPSVAPPVGAESMTWNDSLPSTAVSSVIVTVKVLLAVSPFAQVRLPEVAT